MACEQRTVSSNVTGASFAEEQCLMQLPDTPKWFGLEPNSYDSFGGDLSTVARTPINQSRQNQKGVVTDLDASAGFEQDFTLSNYLRLMRGVMCANARELANSQPLDAPPVAVAGTSTGYLFSQELPFTVGAIVRGSGFVNTPNNGLKIVTAVSGEAITTDVSGVAEAAPTGSSVSADVVDGRYQLAAAVPGLVPGAFIEVDSFLEAANNGVKYVLAVSEDGLTVAVDGEALVTDTGGDVTIAPFSLNGAVETVGVRVPAGAAIAIAGKTTLTFPGSVDLEAYPNIIPGAWVFIGGDVNRFQNNVGYARIEIISGQTLTFDDLTWEPVAETAATPVDIFIGTIIRNEPNPEDIVQRSWHIERTLGPNSETGLTQAEYARGMVANQFELSLSQADKMTASLSFVGVDSVYAAGVPPTDIRLPGLHYSSPAESAYNTTSNVYSVKLSIHDDTTSRPAPLFAYLSDGSLTINNNVNSVKAIGWLGAIQAVLGNLEVTGSFTAYFADVRASRAVRDNADVGLHFIIGGLNAGFLFDVPLLSLGGGQNNVEADSPITVPLEINGAQSKFGYTVLYERFAYLPTIAMPQTASLT